MMKQINLNGIERILVINLAFIGDMLLSSPTIAALKAAIPHAKIDVLATPVTAPIAVHHPDVQQVHIYDKRNEHKGLWAGLKLANQIRQEKYELAICLNFASRGAILAWAAGIPLRIGYKAQQAQWFLTHDLPAVRKPDRHEAENHLAVLEPLGIKAQDTKLRYQVKPEDEASLWTKLPELKKKSSQRRLAFCPIGSYARKSWPLDRMAQVILKASTEATCYLIGGTKEAIALEKVSHQAEGKAQVLAGTLTLAELGAFLKQMDGLITVDTGPLHMAQALQIPTIALYGPTDPKIWGPRNHKDKIFYHQSHCSPCWGKGECEENQCLKTVSAQSVLEVIQKLNRDD